MRRTRRLLARAAVGLTAVIVLAGVLWVVVGANPAPGWLSTATPIISVSNKLPANQSPPLTNRDCINYGYISVDSKSKTACFVKTGQGAIEASGSLIISPGDSLGVPLVVHTPNTSLVPVPGSNLTMLMSNEPVLGSYLHIYTDLSKWLQANYGLPLHNIQSFSVTHDPEEDIRDGNGTRIAFNAWGTLAFSSNGKWLVADAPGLGFMRINIDTLAITPFALSLNGPGDTQSHHAETAVSDDGRYAVIGNDPAGYLRVYDLSTCTGTSNPAYSQPLSCQYRDYRPALAASMTGLHAIYSARFVNDDNLSVGLTYNWQSGSSYSSAIYRLTAPGKLAHGLEYLALGDSYISGEGEFAYRAGTDTATNKCHLSPFSYPYTLGASQFDSYQSVACSGARTNDIISTSDLYTGQATDHIIVKNRDTSSIEAAFDPGYLPQLQFVKRYQPSVVTLSIGGNNIGFAGMLKNCVLPHVGGGDCYDTYVERLSVVAAIDSAFDRLRQTYTQILQADPGVRIYVIGYPQIAAQGKCGVNVHLSGPEIDFATEVISYLDWVAEQSALSAGAYYVDTQSALASHRLCESGGEQIAINGLTLGDDGGILGLKFVGSESYHPNVLGHQLLATWIMRTTGKLTASMPAANPTVARPTVNDNLAQALLWNMPNTGDPPPDLTANDDSLAPDVVQQPGGVTVTLDDPVDGLAANATYQVSLQSGQTSLSIGSITTDAGVQATTQLSLPTDIAAGAQTLHIKGLTVAGRTIDVYKVIYITTNADTTGPCGIVPASGQDADGDGIDDACDPDIAEQTQPTYARVRLIGNSISASRSP